MKLKIHTLALLAAAAAFSAGAVLADDNQSRGVPGVNMDINKNDVDIRHDLKHPILDKNSDGKISREEAKQNKELSRQFSKLDTNHDGFLDESEYAKFQAEEKSEEKNAPKTAKGKTDEQSEESTTPAPKN